MKKPSTMFRPRRRGLLAIVMALLLLLALAVLIWVDNAVNRGVAYGGAELRDAAPLLYTGGMRLGVNAFNLHLEPDPAVVTRTLELARNLGATHVRMQMPWDDLEIHARGDFEDRRNLATVGAVSAWAKYDRIVATAQALNLELVLRLERPPDWARERARATAEFQQGLQLDGNSTGPPDDYADYGNFVQAVVGRYRGKVRYFQLWNEPNLRNEWNWQEPRPEAFVELLRVGYTAAKQANPEAVILFPSLSPTDGLDWRAPMTELEYLAAVYRAGGGAYFDIMAGQAYGLGQPPDEKRYVFLRGRRNWAWRRPIDTRNDVGRIVLLREVMVQHGDAAKPVWAGEFGWNSAPESIPAERRFTWGEPVDEQTKGAYLVGQIERARREWPWMGVMHVWMLRYGGYLEPDPQDPTPYFALVSRDWQPLPAYERLRTFMAQPATVGPGAYTWDSPAVERAGASWRIHFFGTRLVLLEVSGNPAEALVNGALVVLEPTLVNGQTALLTPRLDDGPHMLELRGLSTPPARFAVERENNLAWLWAVVPALVCVLLAAVLVWGMGGG